MPNLAQPYTPEMISVFLGRKVKVEYKTRKATHEIESKLVGVEPSSDGRKVAIFEGQHPQVLIANITRVRSI